MRNHGLPVTWAIGAVERPAQPRAGCRFCKLSKPQLSTCSGHSPMLGVGKQRIRHKTSPVLTTWWKKTATSLDKAKTEQNSSPRGEQIRY